MWAWATRQPLEGLMQRQFHILFFTQQSDRREVVFISAASCGCKVPKGRLHAAGLKETCIPRTPQTPKCRYLRPVCFSSFHWFHWCRPWNRTMHRAGSWQVEHPLGFPLQRMQPQTLQPWPLLGDHFFEAVRTVLAEGLLKTAGCVFFPLLFFSCSWDMACCSKSSKDGFVWSAFPEVAAGSGGTKFCSGGTMSQRGTSWRCGVATRAGFGFKSAGTTSFSSLFESQRFMNVAKACPTASQGEDEVLSCVCSETWPETPEDFLVNKEDVLRKGMRLKKAPKLRSLTAGASSLP